MFARFGIHKTIVSDNGTECVKGDLKQWCNSRGKIKVESSMYHSGANEVTEIAI